MKTEDFKVAAAIAANNEGELHAVSGYYELLGILMDPEDKAIIAEIISDEKNHEMLLDKMALKYDGNIEMAKD